mmetsp:Transcript_3502/g.12621  ORF Transcript_3502/g.12621 Transcript_3502/m.12621 type:complete len:448 (+) Transcript_3502:74-1417(+)
MAQAPGSQWEPPSWARAPSISERIFLEAEDAPGEDGGGASSFCIDRQACVRLGRQEGVADVVLPIPTCSRRHAAIVHGPAGVMVVDLGSSHGTFLDGQKLASFELVTVQLGQDNGGGSTLRFADSSTIYRFRKVTPEPKPSGGSNVRNLMPSGFSAPRGAMGHEAREESGRTRDVPRRDYQVEDECRGTYTYGDKDRDGRSYRDRHRQRGRGDYRDDGRDSREGYRDRPRARDRDGSRWDERERERERDRYNERSRSDPRERERERAQPSHRRHGSTFAAKDEHLLTRAERAAAAENPQRTVAGKRLLSADELAAQNAERIAQAHLAAQKAAQTAAQLVASAPMKRKLLWQKKTPSDGASAQEACSKSAPDKSSTGGSMWETARFADPAQKEKFLKLMGSKGLAAQDEGNISETDGAVSRRQREIEAQFYAGVRQTHQGHGHTGLGN